MTPTPRSRSTLRTAFFFAKFRLYNPASIGFFNEFQRNQRLSADELDAVNWRLTQELLRHAYENVRYYRTLFDGIGMKPEDVKTREDYSRVPVLTRQLLMDHFEELRADGVPRKSLFLSTTGGSTGTPAKVYHPKKTCHDALGWRMLSWWNLPPDCDRASTYRMSGRPHRRLKDLAWWPMRRFLLNASFYTDEDIRGFLDEFNRIKPPLLHGYVGALESVANYILANGIRVHPPTAVWATSAPLSPAQENTIRTAFGADVYDQYGSCEVHYLSAECPAKEGLHIFSDARTLEFLDDEHRPVPDGEYGTIAVTDLRNKVFPIIRYLNGDRGRRKTETCSCGVSLPLMDKVKGRVSDTFLLPSGARLNGESLTTVFDDFPDVIRKFQVRQKKDRSVCVLYVPRSDAGLSDVIKCVEGRMREVVRGEVPVSFEKVEDIPDERGKCRFVVSEV